MKFFKDLLVISHDGNYNGIVAVVAENFRQFKNCEIILQNISENKSNVIVKWGEPELLINVHLDTVCPADGWDSNPYELVEKDGNYYGLGTCDTKGNIYAVSEAVKSIAPKNLMLLFSVDEESNSIESGVTHFLESNYPENIKQAIVCEPTNNLLADSHKGYFSFFLRTDSLARHSSESAFLYENAIYSMSKYLDNLITAGYNLGTIQGGLAGNIIAPDCKLHISIRTFKEYNNVLSKLRRILGNDVNIEPRTILHPLNSNMMHRKPIGIIKAINSEPLEFWTEASLFADKGIDSLIYGVGDIKQAHSPNEFVSKNSLENGINFFIDVIKSENER